MSSDLRRCFLLAACCLVLAIGCDHAPEVEEPGQEVASHPATSHNGNLHQPERDRSVAAGDDAVGNTPLFVEVTDRWGITASAESWPAGHYLTPEITPGGVALFDFDADGDLDIYQVCHCRPAPATLAFSSPAPNRLYRQVAPGKFSEVSAAAGLNDQGYGHGCAIADIDNDGDDDVFVTNYGKNSLYRNDGGKFVNITREAGITGDAWSSAAAFFDYDRDGNLDLFVVNFGVFDPAKQCTSAEQSDANDYCGPHLFDGLVDQLFRNNGDGTFSSVGEQVGIDSPGRGWGGAVRRSDRRRLA